MPVFEQEWMDLIQPVNFVMKIWKRRNWKKFKLKTTMEKASCATQETEHVAFPAGLLWFELCIEHLGMTVCNHWEKMQVWPFWNTNTSQKSSSVNMKRQKEDKFSSLTNFITHASDLAVDYRNRTSGLLEKQLWKKMQANNFRTSNNN